MSIKKFRMFAGPNGSGKSTLIHQIDSSFNLGFFINADNIEQTLKTAKHLDYRSLVPTKIDQTDWINFINSKISDPRVKLLSFNGFSFKDDFLVSKQEINSYHASIIAEFFREKLIEGNQTFSFETVMSHPSKLEFISQAKMNGFKTYLYFVCTQDPFINIQRVKNRVEKGGHTVMDDKIEQRYFRSLELLYDAFLLSDRAFVIDSSNKTRSVIVEKREQRVLIHNQLIPEWIIIYLLDKLKKNHS